MLKAALNHAYDEGHVANCDAWGRRLAPFEKVEVARVRYLEHVPAGSNLGIPKGVPAGESGGKIRPLGAAADAEAISGCLAGT